MPRVALRPADIAAFRGRVVDAAIKLFARHGYDAVTMRALAAELGVAEESFLRASYFGLWQAAREVDPDLPEDMVFGE